MPRAILSKQSVACTSLCGSKFSDGVDCGMYSKNLCSDHGHYKAITLVKQESGFL